MAVPWVVSGIDGEGADDFVGGVLILLAIFWPGATFVVDVGRTTVEVARRKAGWPSPEDVVETIGRGDAERWDGLVVRVWSFPFPAAWWKARDYGEALSKVRAS
jgi:hypothetical protein